MYLKQKLILKKLCTTIFNTNWKLRVNKKKKNFHYEFFFFLWLDMGLFESKNPIIKECTIRHRN